MIKDTKDGNININPYLYGDNESLLSMLIGTLRRLNKLR